MASRTNISGCFGPEYSVERVSGTWLVESPSDTVLVSRQNLHLEQQWRCRTKHSESICHIVQGIELYHFTLFDLNAFGRKTDLIILKSDGHLLVGSRLRPQIPLLQQE